MKGFKYSFVNDSMIVGTLKQWRDTRVPPGRPADEPKGCLAVIQYGPSSEFAGQDDFVNAVQVRIPGQLRAKMEREQMLYEGAALVIAAHPQGVRIKGMDGRTSSIETQLAAATVRLLNVESFSRIIAADQAGRDKAGFGLMDTRKVPGQMDERPKHRQKGESPARAELQQPTPVPATGPLVDGGHPAPETVDAQEVAPRKTHRRLDEIRRPVAPVQEAHTETSEAHEVAGV